MIIIEHNKIIEKSTEMMPTPCELCKPNATNMTKVYFFWQHTRQYFNKLDRIF